MTTRSDAPPTPARSTRSRLGLVAVVVFVLAATAMWTYAFFFASRRSPDKVPDRAWAASAQAICAAARTRIDALPPAATFRTVAPLAEALRQRAAVLDRANDALADQLAQLRALAPADDATRSLAGRWLGDHDRYLADRRAHAVALRDGRDVPFAETTYKESPISNRMNAFARVNLMPRCQTPQDLA